MITILRIIGANTYELTGKSTDTKPTDVGENSTFLELDTSKLQWFTEGAWYDVGTGPSSNP